MPREFGRAQRSLIDQDDGLDAFGGLPVWVLAETAD